MSLFCVAPCPPHLLNHLSSFAFVYSVWLGVCLKNGTDTRRGTRRARAISSLWGACARAPSATPSPTSRHFIVFFTLLLMAFPDCSLLFLTTTITPHFLASNNTQTHTRRRRAASTVHNKILFLKHPRAGLEKPHVILTRPSPAISCYFHFFFLSVSASTVRQLFFEIYFFGGILGKGKPSIGAQGVGGL